MTTLAADYTLLGAFDAATAYGALVPTETEPTGDYVVNTASDGRRSADLLDFVPLGKDANNEDYQMRVYGWSRQYVANSPTVWVPTLLLQLDVTLGNISATAIAASTFMADTIAYSAGDAGAKIVSPANDTPGYVVLDIMGAQKLQFDFDCDTGSSQAAGGSVIYRLVSTST